MVRRRLFLIALAMSLPVAALLGGGGQATASQIRVPIQGKPSPHLIPVPVATRYSSAVLASRPWAYWQVNEKPQSTTALDATGNGHDGTYASCVKLGQTGPIPGDPDTAGLFKGRGCWMTSTPTASYAGAYSIEAWVRPASASKYRATIFDTRGLIGEFSFNLVLIGTSNPIANPTGQALHVDVGDGQEWLTGPIGENVPFAYTAGHWYYIVVTVSPATGTVVFYVNGKHFADVGLANFGLPTLLFDPVHPIAVGGNPRYDLDPAEPFPGDFDGTIGQVAVYKRALCPATVAAHYEAAG